MSAAARGEAAEYRRRGWSPIPIKERSKEPNLHELRPYLTRKATREELGSWSWPGVGIVTGPLSGVLVLDVDGPEGEKELQKHGHPATPMARTAGGGIHLYFKHPEHHVRTGIRVAPGLDVKASGGYVVAPPSIGSNGQPRGRRYRAGLLYAPVPTLTRGDAEMDPHMDERQRRARELDALEVIAAELEKLRILKEHELGVRLEHPPSGDPPYAVQVEE